MERSKRALRRWVVFCLLLSGCGAAAGQPPQEAPPPAQTETREVQDVPTPAPAQDEAGEPAPPAVPRKPLEAPVLKTRELPAFAGDYYLQWEIDEEPWIYSEHPVAHTSTRLMALADGRLQPVDFPNDRVLANYGLPAGTLSQLELVRISPDAETLVYKQPIAFSEPDWLGVCVPYSFRYYVVSGGRMQTFDLELAPDDWEWADIVIRFDRDVRGCLIVHYGPEEYRTYTHIDFDTMEPILLTETGIISNNPDELIYQVVCNGSKAYACTLSGRDPAIRVISMPDRTVILEHPTLHNDIYLSALTDQQLLYYDSREEQYKSISLETQEVEVVPSAREAIDEELRNETHPADQRIVTYYTDTEEGTWDSLLKVQDLETGDSLEIMVPWRWQLIGILPKTVVEAYLQP